MKKRNYLFKRIGSALIDILIFALIAKVLEPFVSYKNSDGQRYIHSAIVFFLYYLVYILQDVFMKKTVGKYIFNLEMTFEKEQGTNRCKKYFRIIIRRIFDLFELVCPFIYLLPIILTKNNQKIGDIISKIIIKPKQ